MNDVMMMVEGLGMVVSLNSRLESNKEEEEVLGYVVSVVDAK